jgi:hypothetical protein
MIDLLFAALLLPIVIVLWVVAFHVARLFLTGRWS